MPLNIGATDEESTTVSNQHSKWKVSNLNLTKKAKMALRVPKLVGSKWVYEYPVSAAQKPESNDGSEPNSEGNLL